MRQSEKCIRYVGFYDDFSDSSEKRNHSLAATNKMTYIASALRRAGYEVHFVSPSWTTKDKGVFKGYTSMISDGITLTMGPTFGARNWLFRKLRILISWLWLFFYLIFHVERGEKVLAYHSLMMDLPLYCAKIIKGFKLILEVEEEYCVVIKQPLFFRWLENTVIRKADYHVLPTELMKHEYQQYEKKTIVVYGNYNVANRKKRKPGSKVTVVYAGIIDSVKAGAFNAIEVAKYLDDRFTIKVIGFGNESDIIRLQERIEILNSECACKVRYEGMKEGRDFIGYLSQCDIGLSTQIATGDYIKFSFPSKILTYLGLGLRVVTSRIDCVQFSKIGDLMYYYENDDPAVIASTILSMDLNEPYDAQQKLIDLDNRFVSDLKKLLNEQ